MKVSFIVPVFNETRLTKACLESLEATLPVIDYEIILVDDGSLPEIACQLDQLTFKNLTVIHASRNQGFAAANNLGVRHSSGEILFLINNDLVLQPGWFEPMRTAFDRFPDLGIIGNIQLNAATKEIDHAGFKIGWDCRFSHEDQQPPRFSKYSRKEAITGACCAIKKSVYQSVGGLDEAFLNGCEDLDICFRLAQRERKILVANRSIVSHHVSSTRGTETSIQQERNFRLFQNRWEVEIKHLAANRWPKRYLKSLLSNLGYFRRDMAIDSISSIARRIPSKTGQETASCCLERNRRHWHSLIDGWTDQMIKDKERRKFSNWLNNDFSYEGLYINGERAEGLWIREKAEIKIPATTIVSKISIQGKVWPADENSPEESGELGLRVTINQRDIQTRAKIEEGKFEIEFQNPSTLAGENCQIEIELLGVGLTNTYAYLGRVWKDISILPRPFRRKLKDYIPQKKNKRLTLYRVDLNGEEVIDFQSRPTSPLNFDYLRKYGNIGINLIGWFDAELGIGESARSAAKAIKQSNIESNFVPLKVNCLANRGDKSLASELQEDNPHPINIFHIDAPQSPDIDHHHGNDFRGKKYNIAYWAWELPEFPDAWVKHFKYFDEIWCPSNFVRDAIAMKSPHPVITIPHSIDFPIPQGDYREKLGLPQDVFLFSFIYDLNSYQERKNPQAALGAFKIAFEGSDRANDVGLVIKTQSAKRNLKEFSALKNAVAGLKNCVIIDQTLPRDNVYGLMNASDCYISLHRSEGFGLTVAESMFLGKPVIATDWSATTEFLNSHNGLPVRFELQELKENFGPYQKGQLWAHPSVKHAAEQMRKVVDEPKLAKRLGSNAAITIRERFSPEIIGHLYEKRLKSIALW